MAVFVNEMGFSPNDDILGGFLLYDCRMQMAVFRIARLFRETDNSGGSKDEFAGFLFNTFSRDESTVKAASKKEWDSKNDCNKNNRK